MTTQASLTLDQFMSLFGRLGNSCWVRNYVVTQCGHLVLEIADLGREGFDKAHQVLSEIGFLQREEFERHGVMCRTYKIKRAYPSCSSLHSSWRHRH